MTYRSKRVVHITSEAFLGSIILPADTRILQRVCHSHEIEARKWICNQIIVIPHIDCGARVGVTTPGILLSWSWNGKCPTGLAAYHEQVVRETSAIER